MEHVNYSYIKMINYVFSFDQHVMNKIIKMVQSVMYFLDNVKSIAEKLRGCNQHCASYDKRAEIADALETIASGAPDEKVTPFSRGLIDFLHQLISVARPLAQRVGYEIKLENSSKDYPDKLMNTFRYLLMVVEGIEESLNTCIFINDSNCNSSRNKLEVIDFANKYIIDCKEAKTALNEAFGCQ